MPPRAPATTAEPFLPRRRTLPALRAAVQDCQGCDLYRGATRAVFGVGPADARLVLVGEMPGDDEDRSGRPFTGPAGRLLDSALAEAGLDRAELYLTNAVKHFGFVLTRGRRQHKSPTDAQITACNPWLVAELAIIAPRLVVCLGASAARAVLRRKAVLRDERGVVIARPGQPDVLLTVHPSAILRVPDRDDRHRDLARLVADLATAKAAVA